MDQDITLSVVLSCYKQEDYIEQCLYSILQQKVNFKFEIIVGDDCSPDNTRVLIQKIASQHPDMIRLHFNERNLGAAKNYFSVHNQATGKYVAHIDGDDVMLPGKLQAQVDVMENNPACNIVFHRSRYFSDDGTYSSDTGSLFPDTEVVFISAGELARWGTIAAHGSYMYRRSSRLTREYRYDFMEWFFAFESVAGQGVAAYINKIYLDYRCNPGGNAYLATRAGREKAYMIIIRHVIHYFEKYPQYRSDLYAQQLVNVAMYVRNIHRIRCFMVLFLLKNCLYFRPAKFLETVKVRSMVAPKIKIR